MSASDSTAMIEYQASAANAIISAAERPASEGMLEDILRALAAGTLLQVQAVHQERGTLSKLPTEVLLLIIGYIEDDFNGFYAKACLALTCSKLYQTYKLVHPGPIEWTVGPCLTDARGHKWEYALQCYIGDFLGPAYRRHRLDSRFIFPCKKWSAFVSRAVYGHTFSMKDAELNERYSDWGASSMFSCPRMSSIFKELPSPYGMAEGWYTVAFNALSKFHRMGYSGVHARLVGFRGPPAHLLVYRRMLREYEEFYGAFGEWVVMMGL